MRLFRENGFDTTTVAEVAEAADVSAMTVFRHFPTKEHLVMEDDYDPLIAERVRRRPAGEPLLRRIATSILEGLDELPPDPHLLLTRTRLILDTPRCGPGSGRTTTPPSRPSPPPFRTRTPSRSRSPRAPAWPPPPPR